MLSARSCGAITILLLSTVAFAAIPPNYDEDMTIPSFTALDDAEYRLSATLAELGPKRRATLTALESKRRRRASTAPTRSPTQSKGSSKRSPSRPPPAGGGGNGGSAGWGFSKAEVDRMVQLTNEKRARTGANPLTWSDKIADNAYRLFKNNGYNSMKHSGKSDRALGGDIGNCGENLASGWASPPRTFTVEQAVNGWYDEVKDCRNSCCTSASGVVGHFTALVWKSCKYLGCARSNNKELVVCQYGGCDSEYGLKGPNLNGGSGCNNLYGKNVQKG